MHAYMVNTEAGGLTQQKSRFSEGDRMQRCAYFCILTLSGGALAYEFMALGLVDCLVRINNHKLLTKVTPNLCKETCQVEY